MNTARKVNLGEETLDALSIVERVCSILSLLGCLFIIFTFCCSKAFHKPINRLVFYASFGNGITNIGTLMARSYIGSPDSPGCQLQAFLIQMFMPADAFWTLAMAVNVYLTFYYKFDAERLRRMEIPYMICCYGIPLIPAMTYIFVRNDNGDRVYGNATLWCWVTRQWEIWRILTFYGPVWLVILITFFIYIRTGGDIYRKRKQLQDFSSHDAEGLANINELFASMKTTEVRITHEVIVEQPQGAIGLVPMERRDSALGATPPRMPNTDAYSVSITANGPHPRDSQGDVVLPIQSNSEGAARPATAAPNARRRTYEKNNAAWTYAKCAILFFTALLITWIPSSANRVYSVVHGHRSSTVLEYMSAFVLPLQGFWNALIYMVTSWKACQLFWEDVRSLGRRSNRTSSNGFVRGEQFKLGGRDRGAKMNYETESMTELAHSEPSRPESSENQRMSRGMGRPERAL
ncbi:G-protein coupled receptor [Verticillium dahliae]